MKLQPPACPAEWMEIAPDQCFCILHGAAKCNGASLQRGPPFYVEEVSLQGLGLCWRMNSNAKILLGNGAKSHPSVVCTELSHASRSVQVLETSNKVS